MKATPRGTIVYTKFASSGTSLRTRRTRKSTASSFANGALAFEDEKCLIRPDRVDETGEQRWHALGSVRVGRGQAVVLIVVHVYREEIDGEEIIRIISVRRANKNDVRRYQEQEVD